MNYLHVKIKMLSAVENRFQFEKLGDKKIGGKKSDRSKSKENNCLLKN